MPRKNFIQISLTGFSIGLLFIVLGVGIALAALTLSNTEIVSDGALTITGTNAGITIGNPAVTSIILATDGSGTSELVLSTGAIDTSEILDGTLLGNDISSASITSDKILNGTITGGDLTPNISISTTGNIETTGSGTIISAGMLSASNGFTVSGGAISLPGSSITNAMLAGSIANSKLALPNSYFVIQAVRDNITGLLSDEEIYEFTAPAGLTLAGAQVYVDSINSTASVTVKEAGVSVLGSAITPSADGVVSGTISDSSIASGNAVTVHVTKSAGGSVSGLIVTLIFKTAHVN